MRKLKRMGWLFLGLLSVQFLAAQAPPAAQSESTPENVARAVEIMIRLKFDVPTACDIKIQSRTPSQFTGYDKLRVIVSLAERSNELDLLISKDNKSLVRFENFDLSHNPTLSIDLQGRPIRGKPDAPVTVINFDDLECPVCARMHEILKAEILERYGDKVRLIYKDNPLTDIHPWAMHAAVDAGCLAQQDSTAYWSFVDYVHTHGQEISDGGRNIEGSFSTLDRLASASGGSKPKIDRPMLLACLRKQDETPIRQSVKEAHDLGLNFTPALIVNGELVRGLVTDQDPARAIDRALKAAESR